MNSSGATAGRAHRASVQRPRQGVLSSAVTVLLLAIAVVACLLPALKAIHVDPVAAIREQ
jgi:hypothetical protein